MKLQQRPWLPWSLVGGSMGAALAGFLVAHLVDDLLLGALLVLVAGLGIGMILDATVRAAARVRKDKTLDSLSSYEVSDDTVAPPAPVRVPSISTSSPTCTSWQPLGSACPSSSSKTVWAVKLTCWVTPWWRTSIV